jgi:hypothetical protein
MDSGFIGRMPMPRDSAEGPAKLGRGGAGVGAAFFRRGADHPAGDFAVKTFVLGELEGFLMRRSSPE